MSTNTIPNEVVLHIKGGRKDINVIITELRDAGATRFDGRMVACPFCKEKSPSGSIYQDTTNSERPWLYKCHSGKGCGFQGDWVDVRAKRLGIPSSELIAKMSDFMGPAKEKKHTLLTPRAVKERMASIGKIEGVYHYNIIGSPTPFVVVYKMRKPDGSKTFRQVTPYPAGRWKIEGPKKKPWPLYNYQAAVESPDQPVVVVEGEKDVNTLKALGVVAVSSLAGAGKAKHANWECLAGREVYLFPDNDEAGLNHMKDVATILANVNPMPKCSTVIHPDDAGDKEDVTDIAKRWWGEAVHEGLTQAEAIERVRGKVWQYIKSNKQSSIKSNTETLREYADDVRSGKIKSWSFSHPVLTKATEALTSGMITLIYGSAGAAKSWFALQEIYELNRAGTCAPCLMLEHGKSYFHRRLLAYITNNGGWTNVEYVRKHHDEFLALLDKHEFELDTIPLYDYADLKSISPDDPSKLNDKKLVVQWIERQFKSGAEVIFIDPVTALATSGNVWEEDHALAMGAKRLADAYHGCVVFITHPSKVENEGKKLSAEERQEMIAGGKTWARFCQTNIQIERVDDKRVSIYSHNLQTRLDNQEINRKVHISKVNNGIGMGWTIGYTFGKDGLRFRELGPIVKKGVPGDTQNSDESQDF